MQGEYPTCGAWATVHALLAADVQPSVSFVTDVMNSALGLEAGELEGITTFKTAQLLEQHYPHDIAVDIPAVRSNGLSVRQVISYVKEAVDKGGVIKATMRPTDSSGGADYHAVCVAGYEVTHEGYMNVQVIDSGCGAGLLTIESLTRELNSGHATPIMAITRAAKTV